MNIFNSNYNSVLDFSGKRKHLADQMSDMSSPDSDYDHKDYRNAEAKLAKNPQLTILKQALIKGGCAKKEYDERQKILNKNKVTVKGNFFKLLNC